MQKKVKVPPSKSITHRAFICGSLADGKSVVINPLVCDDTTATRKCLEGVGIEFREISKKVEITGKGRIEEFEDMIEFDVGESGTTCRLLIPVIATSKKIKARFYGRGRMHKRPVKDLADALKGLGIEFFWECVEGYLPLVMKSSGIKGKRVVIKLDRSSQFLSGLLLAAPLVEDGIHIEIEGEKAVSWPYVKLTLEVMENFGQKVEVYQKKKTWEEINWREVKRIEPKNIKFFIKPASYRSASYTVEGDWSNASYLIGAGLFLDEGIVLSGLKKNSLQGDRRFLDIIGEMGAEFFWKGDELVVKPSKLKGVVLDMGDCPDLVPTVAVIASMAEGPTIIRNVQHLRIKESDRLLAIATEISKVGALVELLEDGLKIVPHTVKKGQKILFSTYGDHRIAMSLSLYELIGIGVVFDQKECVKKSFPEFFSVWESIKTP